MDTLVLSGGPSALRPELLRRLVEDVLQAQLGTQSRQPGSEPEEEVARTVADTVRRAIERSGGRR